MPDEEIARQIRIDLPPNRRAALIHELLEDVERIAATMDTNWEILAEQVDRRFSDKAMAHEWLSKISAVWRSELTKLKS